MSGDDRSGTLVDHNMNTLTMGLTERHQPQDHLIQCDRVPKEVTQTLDRELIKNHLCLKSVPTNNIPDTLNKDVGYCMKGNKEERRENNNRSPPDSEPEQADIESEDDEDHVCETEAEDRQDHSSLETTKRRVCIVKQYAWMKEEMSKSSAQSVASHLFVHERKLLTHADHESILNCSWRREAVEQLLKKVLMGPPDVYEVFIETLKMQEESHIAVKLTNTHASQSEIELFTTLEKSSIQQCLRPNSHESRFQLSNSDCETLLYYLNNKNTIDSLNDHFLSRFLFSIREHTNICHCSLDFERRVRLFMDTMKLCSDCIFKDFCEILVVIEMEHVIKKLERRKQGEVSCKQRQKRKVETNQDMTDEPTTSTTAKRLCVDSSIEHRLVSSIQKSSSSLRLQALDQLGMDVENVNKGSIVIQLCPKMPDSWSRLQENCKTGKIKDFIPVVYDNEAIHDLLEEGEFRLQFTIYTLPKPVDSGGDQKVMFHLETEPEKVKVDHKDHKDQDNPIEEHMDLLCEELEITKDLLAVLKKQKLVPANVKDDIDKQGSRAKKIKYLLKLVAAQGIKGYEVLKEQIKEDNEDLYKELKTRDEVKAIDNKMDKAAKVTKRSSSAGGHRGVFKKELFFSGTVVLKVKRKVKSQSKENLNPETNKDQFEISCPEIINPVCYFQKDAEVSQSSGEVTMVLEEAWTAVGEKPKPQREILIGKRKKRSNVDLETASRKRAESEEKPDEEVQAAEESCTDGTDLKAEEEDEKEKEKDKKIETKDKPSK